jgi:protein FAM50
MAASERFAPATTMTMTTATSTTTPTPGTPDAASAAAPLAEQQQNHGLVSLSDYRKRKAELLDAQGRDALRIRSGGATPAEGGESGAEGEGPASVGAAGAASDDGAASGSGAAAGAGADGNKKAAAASAAASAAATATAAASSAGVAKKKRKGRGVMLSFAGEGEDDDGSGGNESGGSVAKKKKMADRGKGGQKEGERTATSTTRSTTATTTPDNPSPSDPPPDTKITANTSVEFVPRLQSRAVLRREAAEREALRAEFLALQAAVRAAEIAVPFVFHDGTDLPGGTVRVRKGDPVWLFLDRGRKVGATRAAAAAAGGSRANIRARREWARVSVDDLMLVRGTIIIPPVGPRMENEGERYDLLTSRAAALRDLLLYPQQDDRAGRGAAL